MGMRHATLDDFREIYSLIRSHKKWLGHTRTDKLRRRIIANQVIYEYGVVIIYRRYKRQTQVSRRCDVSAKYGDCVLHQIATSKHDGRAAHKFREFCEFIKSDIYLSVRTDNQPAINFYERMGLDLVGETSWGKDQIAGLLYKKSVSAVA